MHDNRLSVIIKKSAMLSQNDENWVKIIFIHATILVLFVFSLCALENNETIQAER